jgi:hypothetical protein
MKKSQWINAGYINEHTSETRCVPPTQLGNTNRVRLDIGKSKKNPGQRAIFSNIREYCSLEPILSRWVNVLTGRNLFELYQIITRKV